MSLHKDLLPQARELAKKEPRRPRQASLRRAVSAAYYALFHQLVEDATRTFIPGRHHAVRDLLARTFQHGRMRDASERVGKIDEHGLAKLPDRVAAVTGAAGFPEALVEVAAAFVELQEARHEADYDRARSFTRAEANDLVALAERAFEQWAVVKDSGAACLYLTSFFDVKLLK